MHLLTSSRPCIRTCTTFLCHTEPDTKQIGGERQQESIFITRIQSAWLMGTDLCSRLGRLQNGCEAMADSVLILPPHEQTLEALSILNKNEP